MKQFALALLAFLPAFGVGSVNQTIGPLGPPPISGPDTRVYLLQLLWIGDSVNGTVPATTINISQFPQLQGMRVISAEIQPNTPSPSPSYSLTLLDQNGVDLLAGQAASLSATLASSTTSILSPPLVAVPTFNVAGNSVASARGQLLVYFSPVSLITPNSGPGLTSNNAFTGNNTFSGNNTFTGTNSFSAASTFTGSLTTTGTTALANSTVSSSATAGQILLGSDGTANVGRTGDDLGLNSTNNANSDILANKPVRAPLIQLTTGAAVTASVGAGWGTSATIGAAANPPTLQETNSSRWLITSGSAAFGASPTVTFTLNTAFLFSQVPSCQLNTQHITGTGGALNFNPTSVSNSSVTFTAETNSGAAFTPAATETYTVALSCF